MKETSNLEFKREFTKTFLKTVSAFANYQGGKILFGVDNDGEVVGVDDPTQMRLNIENSINDNISPVPDYKLSVDEATKVKDDTTNDFNNLLDEMNKALGINPNAMQNPGTMSNTNKNTNTDTKK